MVIEPGAPSLTYLERIDLALASRLVPKVETLDAAAPPETWTGLSTDTALRQRSPAALICGLLELRGLALRLGEVQAVLTGRNGRYQPEHQEYELVHGLARCLAMISARVQSRALPDGEFAQDLFRAFAHRVARFRNNWLRRDMPWDGLLYVAYPDAGDVQALLARFDSAHAYRDVPERFRRLHPVRQSFRICWRLARIAPFPDFNLLMAFLVMNTYLMVRGYPAVVPMTGDRELLGRMVSGPPPHRLLEFEARLAEVV